MRTGLGWLYRDDHSQTTPVAAKCHWRDRKDRARRPYEMLVIGLVSFKVEANRIILRTETFAVFSRVHEAADHDAIVATRLVHGVDPVQV